MHVYFHPVMFPPKTRQGLQRQKPGDPALEPHRAGAASASRGPAPARHPAPCRGGRVFTGLGVGRARIVLKRRHRRWTAGTARQCNFHENRGRRPRPAQQGPGRAPAPAVSPRPRPPRRPRRLPPGPTHLPGASRPPAPAAPLSRRVARRSPAAAAPPPGCGKAKEKMGSTSYRSF